MDSSLGTLLYLVIGIGAVVAVAVRGYNKRSLSYGGMCTSILIGILHILAGWRYAFLLIFFFATSSKFTKMWSSIKKQKEDDYHFGGERRAKQVLCNSFVPTLLSLYILLVRFHLIPLGEHSMPFLENKLLLPTVLAYYCECSADTWGSEIGIVSSTPYLLLLPWKPVPAGTNGGISTLGMGAAVASGLSLAICYCVIQPASPNLPLGEIMLISLGSSIVGTFIDSFLGSVLEESWWCAEKKRIISMPEHASSCCLLAEKERRRVSGHQPSQCGLVCGRKVCGGSEVNLLSSSLTSLLVFFYLYVRYFL